MTRPPLWRSLLAALAYVAATLVVLLLGATLMTLHQGTLFQSDGKVVVLFLGAALLLLGAGPLVYRAIRSMIQYRGH
ncbi:hypothetical protein [Dactylosporangium sp. NPDC051484]|uniref:hypothetical protein n=1 Tax=Dactylosporangium sp. NPDC051484 TaxID=3154942 RepID=UPI00344F8949